MAARMAEEGISLSLTQFRTPSAVSAHLQPKIRFIILCSTVYLFQKFIKIHSQLLTDREKNNVEDMPVTSASRR